MTIIKKSLLFATLAAALGAGIMNTASADDHVNHSPYVHVDSQGWHGDRYYDGHRYWDRAEWERMHQPHHHPAPPPPHREF
jgi:hypothetical protein